MHASSPVSTPFRYPSCQKTTHSNASSLIATKTFLSYCTSTVFILFQLILFLLHNFHGMQMFSACCVILLSIELAPFLKMKKMKIIHFTGNTVQDAKYCKPETHAMQCSACVCVRACMRACVCGCVHLLT